MDDLATDAARNAAENLRAVQLAIRDEQVRHADALEVLRRELRTAQEAAASVAMEPPADTSWVTFEPIGQRRSSRSDTP